MAKVDECIAKNESLSNDRWMIVRVVGGTASKYVGGIHLNLRFYACILDLEVAVNECIESIGI